MYALFEVTFDHYSWDELIAVSAVKENLEDHYVGLCARYPLHEEKCSDDIIRGKSEEHHYVIRDVLEI